MTTEEYFRRYCGKILTRSDNLRGILVGYNARRNFGIIKPFLSNGMSWSSEKIDGDDVFIRAINIGEIYNYIDFDKMKTFKFGK